jgi:MoxR-like ATPase
MDPLFEERTDLSQLREAMQRIREAIGQIIVGQQDMIDLMMAGLLSDGHILIEGVPGVAKTLSAKLLAKTLAVPFSRLQFTPDLMPSDVLGTSVFNPRDSAFQFRSGPIFSSVVLIDEINRAPAKTQSALFEVMEERQVTIDGQTYPMQKPFMVIATQNPIEQEGTYRLPEAQLDRFLFKIAVGYPTLAEEINILEKQQKTTAGEQLTAVEPVLNAEQLLYFRQMVRGMIVDPKLLEYIAKIVGETRSNAALYLGGSPRASLSILQASKALAGLRGRDFVTPDDILTIVPNVLRHRIMLTPEKEMEGVTPDEMIQKLVERVEVPR